MWNSKFTDGLRCLDPTCFAFRVFDWIYCEKTILLWSMPLPFLYYIFSPVNNLSCSYIRVWYMHFISVTRMWTPKVCQNWITNCCDDRNRSGCDELHSTGEIHLPCKTPDSVQKCSSFCLSNYFQMIIYTV